MSDRDALLKRSLAALGDEPFALIGGQALLSYGLARQTDDIDFLVGTKCILEPARWTVGDPAVVLRRSSDPTDPLDGVAVLAPETDDDGAPLPDSPVATEVIVLDRDWARAILARATSRAQVVGIEVPVVDLADLAILKAYAGGALDRSDVASMSERADWTVVRRTAEARLVDGPAAARRNWQRWMRLFDEPGE